MAGVIWLMALDASINVMPTVSRARMALLFLAIAVAGCAPGLAPSADVTTITQGWERYFRIDATLTATARGTEIDGYIYNLYGRPANVRLLAQALDASNNVV